ncbi:hypothetical protein DFJ73DRAFT_545397 [Zopfochytrium polystomum]|nr:hypothetical protein DFJ73DRAFT_545397 [Zopfochytrium polystomum]
MTKSKADLGLNSFTLSFIDPEMQSEYEIYFVKRHLRIWIKNVAAICLGFSAAYAGFLSTAQSGSREWETRFSPSVKGTTNWSNIDSVCPPGWFCMECNPDHICGHYTISYDVAFWCIGVAVPFAGALAAMLFLNELTLARNVSFIFASFSAWLCVVAVEARYAIIAPKSAIYERGFFSILSISCTLTFLKVRFIDAIWSCFVVTVACAVSLIQNFSDGSNAGAVVTTKGAGMFVGAMAVISLVICWSCHESEFFIKQQFIASATLQRDNKKLVSQLKVLHRRFDDQAAELDSPLEKSVMLIKMLQADSALTADHLGVLSEVLKHLTSGNLLTPDLETQAPELLDSDQQAWLFTEIMPKQRRRSNIRRGDGPVFRAPETINEDPRSNSNSVTSSMVASERPAWSVCVPRPESVANAALGETSARRAAQRRANRERGARRRHRPRRSPSEIVEQQHFDRTTGVVCACKINFEERCCRVESFLLQGIAAVVALRSRPTW